LESNYPQLTGNVSGQNYPPPFPRGLLARAAGWGQTLGMIFIFFGDKVLTALGVPKPAWLAWAQENRMMAFGALFVLNSAAQNLANTGAFEIYVDGKPVWSKLDTGRMPDLKEVAASLRRMGIHRR
jgi:selT/selW/selH-like putative selenoprotein